MRFVKKTLVPYFPAIFLPVVFLFGGHADVAAQEKIEVGIVTRQTFRYVPNVRVEIGVDSTTTDANGRGVIRILPGEMYRVRAVNAPCPVARVSPNGGAIRSGGTDREPLFSFPAKSSEKPHLTLILRCPTDAVPGMVRVLISTRASCNDDPKSEVRSQSGIAVRLGDKTYISDADGLIDVDLPPGTYPIYGAWQDHTLGFATQDGLKIRPNESGAMSVTLRDGVATVEVRMFTCDETGQEKARAEITEIGVTKDGTASIQVERSRASGNGFVGMKLRDGDKVTITGTAKIKWLGRDGVISFDEPTARTVIRIRPEDVPAGRRSINPSTLEVIQGMGRFLFPTDHEAVYDENGNRIKFRITAPNAKIFIKGTTFTFGHDENKNTTIVAVEEGVVEVEPLVAGKAPFDLTAGQRAEISPSGVNGPTATATQEAPFVRPKKSTFAVGERIVVDYGNSRAFGWDWVILTQPSRSVFATGPHGSVNPAYALQFDANNNSQRQIQNTNSFPPLPEGDYVAQYISWDSGNNRPVASAPFVVSKATPPAPPPPVGTNPPTSAVGDLSGLWRNPGGNAVYRFRQLGAKLHWGVDAVPIKSFANVFQGDITGNTIEGSWVDLPGSPYVGGGKLFLKVESDCRIVKTSEVNHYGAEVWVRKDSRCDVVGLPQRINSGSDNNRTPSSADRVVATDPLGQAINQRPEPAANKSQPKDEITVTKDNDGVFTDGKSSNANAVPSAKTQPQAKPIATPKPGGSTGTAVKPAAPNNTTARSTPQPQPQQPAPSKPPQQAPGCQTGANYSLFSLNWPKPNQQVMMKFIAPAGKGTGSGDWVAIFRAGETQARYDRLVTWIYLTSPDCVERFYLPAGQFDAYVFGASTAPGKGASSPGNPISGGVRLTVTQ